MRPTALLLTPVLAAVTLSDAHAQFAVASVSPAGSARSVPTVPVIRLTFTAAVDPTTVTAQNIKLTGRWSGPVSGRLAIDGPEPR